MTTVRRTPRGQRTYDALVEAGRRVFERDGFLNARITDIASEARVAHGTFYTHFATKEELFRVVATSVLSRTAPTTREVEYRDTEQAARGIARSTRRYLVRYRENAALMGVIEQVATFDPGVQEMLTERSKAYLARTEAHILAVGRLGVLPDGLDPYSTAIALTSMVSRSAYSLFVGNPAVTKPVDFDQAVRTLSMLWGAALGLTIPPDAADGSPASKE
ncbi:TetR/AcrR family transcriptional regulator [Planotetraspora kaengkrachanensis]|uniref:HTH tetR-type domain-containing protein n=1 Tax=Planotetraspora kaengkrachanensis TaxID=575193 RepID=A0A8J3LUS1_9ACTN|nr:TetR/AcrR family transcriptional regulator [Planotetraspora kaengkrachanensis]GIG78667.1 hypothetical protein Pka01_17940 [Planotetraspora kaengkrachanensis]